MINTLTHRARTICSTPQLLTSELQHLNKVLMQCKYPNWAISRVLPKQQHQQQDTTNKRHIPSGQPTKKKCHIVVPYSQGICESIKTICQKYRVQVYFKGETTLKNLLVSPKDNHTITKKSSVIYWFKCGKIYCGDEYIGESSTTFGVRYKEHLNAPSPIFEHQNNMATQFLWKTLRS